MDTGQGLPVGSPLLDPDGRLEAGHNLLTALIILSEQLVLDLHVPHLPTAGEVLGDGNLRVVLVLASRHQGAPLCRSSGVLARLRQNLRARHRYPDRQKADLALHFGLQAPVRFGWDKPELDAGVLTPCEGAEGIISPLSAVLSHDTHSETIGTLC